MVEQAFRVPRGRYAPEAVALKGGNELTVHGHAGEAARLYAIGLEREGGGPTTPATRIWRARLLLAAGRFEEAEAAMRALAGLYPDRAEFTGSLGVALARLGPRAEAAEILSRLEPERYLAMEKPRSLLQRARLLAALGGDTEEASRVLGRAVAAGLSAV